MKKKLSALALALVLALSLCLTGCGGSDTLTLGRVHLRRLRRFPGHHPRL